ncbi:MAG TPA: hypothetical protein DEQ40_16365 [Oxalobacteraceae bacterium]|jgi:hypothetical protein|nr:hypothetical protein [Oxalobacteraceae bacterium]
MDTPAPVEAPIPVDGPYPQSNDKTRIIVFSTVTGEIRQVVRTTLVDMERQHASFPDCDYLETADPAVTPETHMVDMTTKALVVRITPTAGARALKEQELRTSAVIISFQSSAQGTAMAYHAGPDGLNALMIAGMTGGAVGGAMHTPAQAWRALTDYATLRSANAAKLLALLSQVSSAADAASLALIVW